MPTPPPTRIAVAPWGGMAKRLPSGPRTPTVSATTRRASQSAVGQDLAVELIAGGAGGVGSSWGAARGAGHACGMISGRSRRGEKRAQKKTSGGVAPIHLRKCATAREPYEISILQATGFVQRTRVTIPLLVSPVNRPTEAQADFIGRCNT